jgi:hypothetical protein
LTLGAWSNKVPASSVDNTYKLLVGTLFENRGLRVESAHNVTLELPGEARAAKSACWASCSSVVCFEILLRYLISWHQPVVPFLKNPNVTVCHAKFEESDQIILDELRRDSTANELRKFFFTAPNILPRLYGREAIRTTFRLDGQNVLPTALIDSDIYFVYLNLSQTGNCRSKMVLKRVPCYTEKNVQKSVVTDFC